MPRKGANVTLSSYDEIFTTEEGRTESQQEHVQMIPLSELHPFEGHPFRVVDDEEMQKTVESVKQYGVLTPAIARPDPDGGYEIISGHRRLRASELAGLDKLPVIVREMDDDTAIIFMVDSNLQREHILPSERAFAYKMKMDAIKHQGQRADLTCGQLGHKLDGRKSREIIAEQTGDSARTVQRYVRLTELIPEIRDMVDEKKIAFNPAVELSYLKPEEQKEFLEAEAKLRRMGFSVMNPVDIAREVEEAFRQEPTRADYILACLERMKMAQETGILHGVYLIGDIDACKDSHGVQMELHLAEILGIPVFVKYGLIGTCIYYPD